MNGKHLGLIAVTAAVAAGMAGLAGMSGSGAGAAGASAGTRTGTHRPAVGAELDHPHSHFDADAIAASALRAGTGAYRTAAKEDYTHGDVHAAETDDVAETEHLHEHFDADAVVRAGTGTHRAAVHDPSLDQGHEAE